MKNPKIYTDSYQLTMMLFGRTKAFSKALRPTLGREIEKGSLGLLLNLRRALVSSGRHRTSLLQLCSNHLDDLKILSQLSFDLKALGPGGFQEISELTTEIGKELGGLMKYEARGKTSDA